MASFQPYSDNAFRPSFHPEQSNYSDNAWGANQYPPSTASQDPLAPVRSFATNPQAATAGYSPVTAADYPNTHGNMESSNSGPMWSAPEKARSGSKKKWFIIGGVVLVVIVGVAVGVGVAVSNKGGSSSSSSSNTSGSNGGSSSNPSPSDMKNWVDSANKIVKYNPKDLSQFQKDDRLKPSLYGMAYTPLGAILPDCGATFDQVLEDVYLMSQLTTRVRLYGTDCNATDLVMDAIQQTKTNLSVYIGIYVNDDDTVYQRQRDAVKRILETYDPNRVLGITVGNEYILNNMTALGLTDATGPAGITAANYLISKVQDTKSMLSSMSLPKTIPVGNGDAGSYTNKEMLAAVDYFMSNIHPWFGKLPVAEAAQWTWQFFEDNNVAMAAGLPNNPELFIAEVGWPSNSSTVAAETNGPARADEPSLNSFISEWICPANKNGTKYFWFENMDQPWKTALYGGVEGYWGLFDDTKHLKNVELPDCPSS